MNYLKSYETIIITTPKCWFLLPSKPHNTIMPRQVHGIICKTLTMLKWKHILSFAYLCFVNCSFAPPSLSQPFTSAVHLFLILLCISCSNSQSFAWLLLFSFITSPLLHHHLSFWPSLSFTHSWYPDPFIFLLCHITLLFFLPFTLPYSLQPTWISSRSQ